MRVGPREHSVMAQTIKGGPGPPLAAFSLVSRSVADALAHDNWIAVGVVVAHPLVMACISHRGRTGVIGRRRIGLIGGERAGPLIGRCRKRRADAETEQCAADDTGSVGPAAVPAMVPILRLSRRGRCEGRDA